MAKSIKIITTLITFLWSAQLLAWGVLGHETVAVIAYNHLNDNVKEQVNKILANDDFVTSAIWADQIKRQAEWHHTSPYHFANMPTGVDYLSSLKQDVTTAHTGDVVQAILKAETVLRDQSASGDDKTYALKFLIHFVGDIHQPLHTGAPIDLGGNKIQFQWQNRKMNLHSLWDTYMFEDTYKGQLAGKTPTDQANWFAGYLEQKYSVVEQSVDLFNWVAETAKYQSTAYDTDYQNNPSAYQAKALPVMEQQIMLAGYRLAAYLNSIFSDIQMTQANIDAVSQIQQILPNFLTAIDLTPDTGAVNNDQNYMSAAGLNNSKNMAMAINPICLYKEYSTMQEFDDGDND